MKFSPGVIGAFLTGAGQWQATLAPQVFRYSTGKSKFKQMRYESICEVIEEPGVIWDRVTVKFDSGELQLDGLSGVLSKRFADAIRTKSSEALLSHIEANQDFLKYATNSLNRLLNKPQYISCRDLAVWSEEAQSRYGKAADSTLRALKNPLFPWSQVPSQFAPQLELLNQALNSEGAAVRQRNETFVISEAREYEQFFNEVEQTPLTPEQCRAAIVLEDRNLLVAAAGSGKTSSVVGKLGYALKRDLVRPEEVLVLAFNNHAARELETRISERLAEYLVGRTVKVKTFHALGLEIIAEVENVKPSVPDFVSDSGGAGIIQIGDLADTLLKKDPEFTQNWIFFQAIYSRPSEDPANFKDAREWARYLKDTGDYSNGETGYRTLNGELVKSQGELAIANWLFMKGIPYEYERPYKFRTVDKHYRQYHPDFYLPEIDTYVEHYALDAQGNPPPAFGKKYAQSLEWKRSLHADKQTNVIETFYSDFQSGSLFPKLEAELAKRNAQVKPRSIREIQAHVKKWLGRIAAELPNLILTFIRHAKSNQVSMESLASKAKKHRQPGRAAAFVSLVRKLMLEYESKLAEAKSLDFEDMIIKSGQYAKEGKYSHPWRLILVDEFQDISRARANLLTGLLNHSPECKMFAVGDDWQSIYRFAGSDIGIFTRFEEVFGRTATNYLTQTFRSNQGIADVAAQFVQRNSAQIKKSVVANDKTTESVIVIRKIEKREHVSDHILACLDDAAMAAKNSGERRKVFLLGRYNHQRPDNLNVLEEQYGESLDLEFRTIHRSKGLQADYVVVLGMQGGKVGFPSFVADDPLLELVMPQPETFPHAEERRLFYVALTRARHRVYLLVSKYLPSCFVEELEKMGDIEAMLTYPEANAFGDSGQPLERCPQCKKGRLRLVNGKYGPFYGCSEYPSCRYTRDNAPSELSKAVNASERLGYH